MTTNESPLQTALAAKKPLPASNIEECADVLRKRRRIVTVDDHHRWRLTGKPPHEDDADLADLLTELRHIERNHHE